MLGSRKAGELIDSVLIKMTNKIEKIILSEITLSCVFCAISRKSPETELFQLPPFPLSLPDSSSGDS